MKNNPIQRSRGACSRSCDISVEGENEMKAKKAAPQAQRSTYTPTARERAADMTRKAECVPDAKIDEGEVTKTSENRPHELRRALLQMNALGTSDWRFYNGLIGQIANVSSQG